MSIDIWGGWLGAVYLGDTLIAGWGWGGDAPDWVAIPVPGAQSSATQACYWTSWCICYTSCCWFHIFDARTSSPNQGTKRWRMIYTWCNIIPCNRVATLSGVSDIWVWSYPSYYWWFLRDWSRCTCYVCPAWCVPIRYCTGCYRWICSIPFFWCFSYDYTTIIVWCKIK